jgi:hypothetical protein
MASSTGQLWTRDDIASYLGIKLSSVNAWLIRHGVEPAGREVSERGHAKNLYRPSDVRTAKRKAPGSGNYPR